MEQGYFYKHYLKGVCKILSCDGRVAGIDQSGQLFVMPIEEWTALVDKKKYPFSTQTYCFEEIDPLAFI